MTSRPMDRHRHRRRACNGKGLPPSDDTMVSTFVQETDEGGIRLTEHLYLMEEEETLVLRLKHFTADLTG